ncbi:MAG TPA: hypothetical protein VN814_13535 [Caulobacteraceae bacterium]|nr:hypothetical protein [Caulobacteraceae bacterium]
MRARGYALSELLVAVAITGLIVGVLTFLNVDYVGLARRVVDIQAPYAIGHRAETGANLDRCAEPGATLIAIDNEVEAQIDNDATPVLTLGPSGTETDIVTAGGAAGRTAHPVRAVVETAPSPGGGVALLEIGDATVGVIAPRCDLAEVCAYDMASATCRKASRNAEAANAAGATNAAGGSDAVGGSDAAQGGQTVAGHG